MLSYFSDFYKKTIQERIQILNSLFPQLNGAFTDGIDLKTADLLIENCIGKMSLPVGLGLHFQINSKDYLVPMATEEPSIIAAASSAAKFIKTYGGFTASTTAPIMQGQIHVLDITPSHFDSLILSNKAFFISQANTFYCPRMVARGGGVIDLNFQSLTSDSGVVEISVNVGEAMGANIVNTICEGLANDVQKITNCRLGMKILSNYCTERKVFCMFRVPIKKLAYKSISGEKIAQGIMESYSFAKASVYRACTHNKGILNGIQAVGVATGQDTRAIEAAVHTWASRSGKYQPVNEYLIENGELVGKIEIPIAIGTKGGVFQSNPSYQGASYILGQPSSSELSQVLASVGLACNFAAIRAMISEGIQKGHMGLHAKNIAISVGVPSELVNEVVDYMKQRDDISRQTALDYLSAHHLHIVSRNHKKTSMALNTFYANLTDSNPPLRLSIAFHCPNMFGVHVSLEKTGQPQFNKIPQVLFSKHSYSWITSFMTMLEKVKFQPQLPRNNEELQIKLKLICIWLNEISVNLIRTWGVENTRKAIAAIVENNKKDLEKCIIGCEGYIEYAVFLELELWHVLNYHLEGIVTSAMPCSDILAGTIKKEVQSVLEGNIRAASGMEAKFEELLLSRKKMMCATLMYLCDCLGEAKVDLELIQNLEAVGDVLEVMSSATRDFNKVIHGEKGLPNLFMAWTREGKSPDDYFKHIQSIINNKTHNFSEVQKNLVKKAEKLLNQYYNIIPKL